jgi:predicted phosphodiesterase
VLLAVFSDIHGNRQAFEACLKVARAKGAERFVLLGDFVGYGADPEWVVDTVMGLVREGAIAVRGNHDEAVNTTTEAMNAEAQIAIEWTRGRLDVAQPSCRCWWTRRSAFTSTRRPQARSAGTMSVRRRMLPRA